MRAHGLPVVLVVLALAGVAACGSETRPGASRTAGPPSSAAPTPTATSTTATTPPGTTTSSAYPPSSPRTSPPSTITPGTGPVWPIEPRTIPAVAGRGTPVLKEIRTAEHGSYERLVVEFTAPYGSATVRYVPVVRQDPSDRVVPLQGRSFLQIVIQRAVAKYAATPITPYAGPSTVTPGYPTLRQVTISGDFEAVLSFGVGLSRTAGFQVQRLTAPDRLVIDVAEPPAWRMWPEDSRAQALEMQAAFDQGHQPWRGSPEDVARLYASSVYGWDALRGDLDITRVPSAPPYTYRLAAKGSSDYVTVRAVPAFARANSIVVIADTR